MITTLLRSQTLAVLPNSRLNTPIVPGPQTSCVISTSAFTQTLSPASTRGLPAARASIFSVSVIDKLCEQSIIEQRDDFNLERRVFHARAALDQRAASGLITATQPCRPSA